MSIKIIDTLEPLGRFPAVKSKDVEVEAEGKRLDEVIAELEAGGGDSKNYNDLVNQPQVNGVTLTGDKSTTDLGIIIPTKTSQLQNDSNFLTEHQSLEAYAKKSEIPNVPQWAMAATKPAYEKSEIGLGNVDNTSDITKPISAATQSALDEKANNSTVESVRREASQNTEDISILSGRVDAITTLPSGSTSGDAELIDIRTGTDGILHTNAGTAVRNQVSDLRNTITDESRFATLYAGKKTLFDITSIELGGLEGIEVNSKNYRVHTVRIVYFPQSVTVSVKTGFEIGYATCSDYKGSSNTWSGWRSQTFTLAQGYYKFQIKRKVEDTSETADTAEFASAIILSDGKDIADKMKTIPQSEFYGNPNHTIVQSSYNTKGYSYPNLFTADSVTVVTDDTKWNGLNIKLTNVIPGKTIKVSAKRNIGNDRIARVYFYNADGSKVDGGSKDVAVMYSPAFATIPAGTAYVEVVICACWDTALGADTVVTFSDISIAYTDVSFDQYRSQLTTANNAVYGNKYPLIYSADNLAVKTTSDKYTGLDFYINEPILGAIVKISAHRDTGNNWSIRTRFLDASGSQLVTETTTNDDTVYAAVPEGCARIQVTLAACWGTALGADVIVNFSNVSFKYVSAEDYRGSGNQIYSGDKIVLAKFDDRANKCDIHMWKNFLVADIPASETYNLGGNQSIALYDDVMFLFSEGGRTTALDYATKEILSSFDLPTVSTHANSAQFTDLFYDDADTFPLLLVSYCAGNGTDPYADRCEVIRLRKNGNTYTASLINTIFSNAKSFGASWAFDKSTRNIYQITQSGGSWAVRENNPIKYYAWKMPSASRIISGEQIELDTVNAVECTTETGIMQGAAANNGIVYTGVQEISGIKNLAYMWAVDPVKGRIVSRVKLITTKEPEGVAIYDGKMYISQRNDDPSVNPLQVYELVF